MKENKKPEETDGERQNRIQNRRRCMKRKQSEETNRHKLDFKISEIV